MGCGHHSVVRFLADRESLKEVDSAFKGLVKFFHHIPFCATFGVSCAGHFRERADTDKPYHNTFYPSPWGHLNIIVLSNIPHIQELLRLLKETIETHSDVSFKKIKHVFGPSENSRLEVWEIRIGDNGCLKILGEEYYGAYLSIKGNNIAYEDSKKRCEEIELFWGTLEKEIAGFCKQHKFKRFGLKKRI
ncbi:MAG: hypothetical protein AAB451_03735 [Patescibacteria group bacterium]